MSDMLVKLYELEENQDCLRKIETKGYAYAIIGGAGPEEFYRKVCGAEVIKGSTPGIYKNMLS